MERVIWIDMLNPSHPLFFRPLVKDLGSDCEVKLTVRERGETIALARTLGIPGKAIGRDYDHPVRKTLAIALRTLQLAAGVGRFDTAISFENPMSVAVAKMRGKRSILLLDNDLKMKIKGNPVQSLESRVKFGADHIIVPGPCEATFKGRVNTDRMISYDGFKEDFSISDYVPDRDFHKNLPFSDYVVVRPEALASFYVQNKSTIVPELIEGLLASGENVVFLPRGPSDPGLVGDLDVHIPKAPLNGLDLIYHSRAVLTGSGTMAREGGVMGMPSVSCFPNDTLLSVDEAMIGKGLIFHSRDVQEILEHLKGRCHGTAESPAGIDLTRSQGVKNEIISIIRDLIRS